MNRYRIIALAAIIIVIIAAVFLVTTSEPEVPLAGTSWRLVSIDGNNMGRTVTLVFTSDEFSGDTSCNVYRGSYTRIGRNITASSVENTDVGCENVELEINYFDGLNRAEHIAITNGRLTITGSHTLIFEPAEVQQAQP
jgi:heat shock protein HslJ